MKTFLKVVFAIIIVFILIGIAEFIFDFDIGKMINSSKLTGVTTNIGQETLIPVFQIVSLESFYPSNIGLMSARVRKILGLEFGEITLLYEYDSYVKFGVRNPKTIKIERVGDTLYVDESTIIIELLDFKINNFKHKITSASNPSVRRNMDDAVLLEALNLINRELEDKMRTNGRSNFEFAKKNFMENYENMCRAMGLEVVWR